MMPGQANRMFLGQNGEKTWSRRRHITSKNLALSHNHWVLTDSTLAAPPWLLQTAGASGIGFGAQFCLGRRDLCVPLAYQMQEEGQLDLPHLCREDPSELRVSFLAHWDLPSPGLVSFKCRFYYYSGMITGDK